MESVSIVTKVSPTRTSGTSKGNQLKSLDHHILSPKSPMSPSLRQSKLFGLTFGFSLGLALAFTLSTPGLVTLVTLETGFIFNS